VAGPKRLRPERPLQSTLQLVESNNPAKRKRLGRRVGPATRTASLSRDATTQAHVSQLS